MAKHRAAKTEDTTAGAAARLAVGLLAGVVVSLAVALVAVPALIGADTYVVSSGSMEPGLPVGSVIVVRTIDVDDVQRGDVVTFRLPTGDVTTHRVVEIDQRGLSTKGDANDDIDPWVVTEDALLGEVRYTVPFVGYLRHPKLATTGASFNSVVATAGGTVGTDPFVVAATAVEPPATTTTTVPEPPTTTTTTSVSEPTTTTTTSVPEPTTTTTTSVPEPTTTTTVPASAPPDSAGG